MSASKRGRSEWLEASERKKTVKERKGLSVEIVAERSEQRKREKQRGLRLRLSSEYGKRQSLRGKSARVSKRARD